MYTGGYCKGGFEIEIRFEFGGNPLYIGNFFVVKTMTFAIHSNLFS